MLHPGEVRVQQRANVLADAWGSAGVGKTIPPVAAAFLTQQRFLVVGAEHEGSVWATPLTGEAGFARALDQSTIEVNAVLPQADPLAGAFDRGSELGLIALEPATRRRMRVNGQVRRTEAGLLITTDQVYSNCPKYIQTRSIRETADRPVPSAAWTESLDASQERWIAAADTFFVATSAPGFGIDASHRGGNPGFVRVDAQRLTWPDYVGNSMFMTLGNLDLDPRAGLLFLDWEHGHTLHLTGRAKVDWAAERAAAHPGAQRIVDFEIEQVVQINHRTDLAWTFEKFSRFNPS